MKDGRRNLWHSGLISWFLLLVVIAVLVFLAAIPMTWQQQAWFGGLVVVAGLLLDRTRPGRVATLVLVLLCLTCTFRYAFWRTSTLWAYLHSPWSHVSLLASALMLILLAAEMYTFVILVLGFFQSVAPLQRPPLLMPEDLASWPLVDVLIPTYNEPLDVVRYTVLAARQMDWPADKLNVVLLDDGGRKEFQQFAAEAGVGYIARSENTGAKAGNLNNGLRQIKGEFVTIFDCDHIPTRSFLQISLGWFLRDEKLAMLQTPHHFYSPDPFERNLGKFRKIPSEGRLFYGIVQDANDLWNATYFCGSCATLRRSALDEVGGIAQATVTEDAHTSLRLQSAGWNTAYINIPQAAGLATETLARHVKQRIRWARGMVRILRIDNPLFARRLTIAQRLCYFNATLHFLYAAPRLVFLTAPLLYLFFGMSNVPGYWLAILAFAGPHLALTIIANPRIQGSKRHSFWNEIYETVLSPFILLPTLLALVSSKSSFNVTDKGGAQERGYFSLRLSLPFLILLGLNLAGLALAIPRYLYWDRGHLGTIAMNVFWCLFNIVILGVTLSVCAEERQRRHAVRIPCSMPVVLHQRGELIESSTVDLSTSGVSVKAAGSWAAGEPTEIEFPEDGSGQRLQARVTGQRAGRLGLKFDEMSLAQQMLLTRVLYSRADRWLEWDEGLISDSPLRSLLSVLRSSVAGFWKLLFLAPSMPAEPSAKPLKPARAAVISSLILVVLALAWWRANASTPRGRTITPLPTIQQSFTLGELAAGRQELLLLDQPGSRAMLKFATPASWLIRSGKLHLKYRIPRNAQQDTAFADVRLNESVLASVTPTPDEREAGVGELWVPLPPELLAGKNQLAIQLAGQGNVACRTAAQKDPAWLRIDPGSEVVLDAQPLALANELSALPLPFLEHLANEPVTLPIIFAQQPDALKLQTAGVLASWLGVLADDGGVRFVIRQNELPLGNAVVLLSGSEDADGITGSGPQASVALLANPRNPYAKLLVVHAQTEEELLTVTQALATGQLRLKGSVVRLEGAVTLPQRRVNDAPRWIQSSRAGLDDLIARGDRRNNGQKPLDIYLHLAPDYNFGVQQRMYLHLAYQVDAANLANSSNVAANLNGVPLGSLPLQASPEPHSVDIPIVDAPAAVYANTLQLQFYFVSAGADPCAPATGSSSAHVLPSSFIDLGNAVHYTELPNLRLFAKAGFPFTRMADLNETAVLLPPSPADDLTALYLDLMAYFGMQTGYPVLRVQVASLADAASFANKDLLILGTFADLGEAAAINDRLPLTYAGSSFALSPRAHWALLPDWMLHRDGGAWQSLNGSTPVWPDGLVEAIASPFHQARSVVVIAGRDRAAVPWLTASLLTTMPLDGIDQSVSLFTTGRFISYPLSTASYGIGELPWYRSFSYWLPHHLLVLLIILFSVLAALSVALHQWLAARIRLRLGPLDHFQDEPVASPQ